jgi:DNA damage-binding protein 1
MVLLALRECLHFDVACFGSYFSDRYRDVGDASASEISAISCTPMNPSKNFTNYIAVSFWGSNQVKLFSPQDGLSVICQAPALQALPRSLLFYNFGNNTSSKAPDYHPHLLIGLADGTVVSYSWRNNELSDSKTISLGDIPVFLNVCQVDGRKALFACGSRASILFWDKETLRHSPVILKACKVSHRTVLLIS